MTPPGVTFMGELTELDGVAADVDGESEVFCGVVVSLVGDKLSLNLCRASKLALSHSLVYCNPSRLFSATATEKEIDSVSFVYQSRTAFLITKLEGSMKEESTFLNFEEVFKLGSLVFNRVLLNEGSSLLQREVCHVQLHQFQHFKHFPAGRKAFYVHNTKPANWRTSPTQRKTGK